MKKTLFVTAILCMSVLFGCTKDDNGLSSGNQFIVEQFKFLDDMYFQPTATVKQKITDNGWICTSDENGFADYKNSNNDILKIRYTREFVHNFEITFENKNHPELQEKSAFLAFAACLGDLYTLKIGSGCVFYYYENAIRKEWNSFGSSIDAFISNFDTIWNYWSAWNLNYKCGTDIINLYKSESSTIISLYSKNAYIYE